MNVASEHMRLVGRIDAGDFRLKLQLAEPILEL